LYLLFSIAIAGAIPLMYSTGLSKRPKIVGGQAYISALPSAYKVSKAKLDFPEPESPVITTNLFLVWQHLHF
jgi:hypothetical protein